MNQHPKGFWQGRRAIILGAVFRRVGITSDMLRKDNRGNRSASSDLIALAETIARFNHPASEETLGMCEEYLRELEALDALLGSEPDYIRAEGSIGSVGTSNADAGSSMPVKMGVLFGGSSHVMVRMSVDEALDVATRLIQTARGVAARQQRSEVSLSWPSSLPNMRVG